MPPYFAEIPGYKLTATQLANGVMTKTEVDYQYLDITRVDQLHQSNILSSVEYASQALRESVKTDMVNKGLTCK